MDVPPVILWVTQLAAVLFVCAVLLSISAWAFGSIAEHIKCIRKAKDTTELYQKMNEIQRWFSHQYPIMDEVFDYLNEFHQGKSVKPVGEFKADILGKYGKQAI